MPELWVSVSKPLYLVKKWSFQWEYLGGEIFQDLQEMQQGDTEDWEAPYVFSYNFTKLEGKTNSIKVRYPFLMQSCMVILLIYDTILYSRRLVGVKGEGPSAQYKTTYRDL